MENDVKQVRYYLQAKKKGSPNEAWAWNWFDDSVYDGWFNTSGAEEPSDTLKETVDEHRTDYPHLDFRLMQEFRTRYEKAVY